MEPVHHDLDDETLHLEKHRRAVHSPPLRACQRQGASGTGCMILPPNKLKGWRPTSSMPGRCDISGCDLTHPPPLQVPKSLSPPSPALANLPPKYPGRAASWQPFTEKCVMAMWELWQQNAIESQKNPNGTPTSPQQNVRAEGGANSPAKQ